MDLSLQGLGWGLCLRGVWCVVLRYGDGARGMSSDSDMLVGGRAWSWDGGGAKVACGLDLAMRAAGTSQKRDG